MRLTMFAFLTIAAGACGGQTTTGATFALESEGHIALDAAVSEPRASSRTLNFDDAIDASPGPVSSATLARSLCPIKCTMAIPGRSQNDHDDAGGLVASELIEQVQPAIERLTTCDAAQRPAPTLTLRFGQDGALVATGVDEETMLGEARQCLHERAGREALPQLRSLPGAIVRCQERCAPRRRLPSRSKFLKTR